MRVNFQLSSKHIFVLAQSEKNVLSSQPSLTAHAKRNGFQNCKSFILTNFLRNLKNTLLYIVQKKSFFFVSHNSMAKIFLNELNLNFPFCIRQQNTTDTNGIHTHAPNNRLVTNPLQGRLVQIPKHLPNMKHSQWQLTSEPIGKMPK